MSKPCPDCGSTSGLCMDPPGPRTPSPTRSAAALVNAQAEDPGLWFVATTATEAYLQAALRRLHAAVEAGAGNTRSAGDRDRETLIGALDAISITSTEDVLRIKRYARTTLDGLEDRDHVLLAVPPAPLPEQSDTRPAGDELRALIVQQGRNRVRAEARLGPNAVATMGPSYAGRVLESFIDWIETIDLASTPPSPTREGKPDGK